MKVRAALLVVAGVLLVLFWLHPARSWVTSARPQAVPVARALPPALPAPRPRAGTVLAVDGGLAIVESVDGDWLTLIEADGVTGELRRRSCSLAACTAPRPASH